jgi:hypothetical protein
MDGLSERPAILDITRELVGNSGELFFGSVSFFRKKK